ncbi:MAG: 1-acyl-sn-glycerol-3-phosphate acyltransferase, partial [Pseudomonadota bacterium]|nr:1-acyl-sn-glycerol-3-phosphate acyltransferase [Pseudomonadota bacterium]
MTLLRGLALLLFQSVVTPLFAVLMILAIPLGGATVFALAKTWCSLNVHFATLLGMPHVVELESGGTGQPAVILAKHSSAWETFFIVHHFPRLVPVVKRELLRVPFFGWGLALCRPIAIDRSARREARNQLTEQGQARLADGLWVMVFPEGTRIPAGQRGRYASGGASVAMAASAPVIAVAHDAGFFWRKSLLDKRAGTIHVAISAPMFAAPGESATDLTRRAEEWIESRIEGWGHPRASLTAR